MSDTPHYEPSKAVGSIDKILLRAARSHKSAKEMSVLTGGVVSPAAAAVRVQELLDSRDWYTDAQKKMLLLDDMMELKDVLYEKAVEFKNIEAAGPLINVLNSIQKVLAQDKVDWSKALREVTRAQAQMMLEAVSAAMNLTLIELEKRYGGLVRKDELHEVMSLALPAAIAEVEARVASDE